MSQSMMDRLRRQAAHHEERGQFDTAAHKMLAQIEAASNASRKPKSKASKDDKGKDLDDGS